MSFIMTLVSLEEHCAAGNGGDLVSSDKGTVGSFLYVDHITVQRFFSQDIPLSQLGLTGSTTNRTLLLPTLL